jgi:hypothetical protein
MFQLKFFCVKLVIKNVKTNTSFYAEIRNLIFFLQPCLWHFYTFSFMQHVAFLLSLMHEVKMYAEAGFLISFP